MADDVLAEPDPNVGLLQPVPGQQFGPAGPLGGINPVGFKPDGVGDDLQSDPVVTKPGLVNSDASPNKPNVAFSDSAGTAGGKGPVGVNGSHAALPFGLDPARTPVMGSYGENSLAATATSAWYQLPPRHSGAAAGGGLRRRRHLVIQGGRQLHLRAVAETAMGRHPARRQHRAARAGAADRHRPAAGVAQSALPADLGPAGGQRGAHRRLRPEPELRPVVRVHAAAGAGAAEPRSS